MTTNSGLLLLDKPQGLTSHDVVARVRKVTNERRVGHAGTLDPMATGLLVVAVGPSTRLLRFAQGEVKRYSGTVKFGVATASLDAGGEVVEERPVPLLSSADAQLLARGMLGPQQQTPPMVSAIKVGGRRLHELARQGLEVEREARDITISDFSVSATGDPSVWEFEVECTVGHLTSLRRVSSGGHHVEDALSLDELEALVVGGGSPFQAPLAFVESLERTTLSEDQERRMRMGQQIEIDGSFVSGEIVAVNARGAFAAILRRRGEKWKPEVVLPAESDRAQG